MPKVPYDDKHLDAVARLTQDIVDVDEATMARLQGLVAAVLEATRDAGVETLLSRLTRLEVPEEDREAVRGVRLTEADRRTPPLHMTRIDEREDLLEARVAGPLSALGGAERLGPFVVDGGRVWFEFYRPARRFVVTETGASAPALVMTSARRPVFSGPGPLKLDLQAGTIWIRGDLLTGDLPAGAYVGITIDDGKLTLPNTVSVAAGEVEVVAPMEATLSLKLRADAASLSATGCNAQTSITLPDLTLTFGPAGPVIEVGAGKSEAWGQSFEFEAPSGTMDFIAPLWTLLLGFSVTPQEFDASAIGSDLVDFQGKAQVTGAGLGLPVVVANPAILGPRGPCPAGGWRWRSCKRAGMRPMSGTTGSRGGWASAPVASPCFRPPFRRSTNRSEPTTGFGN